MNTETKTRIAQKPRSLLRSTTMVSMLTMLSRLFGFARDMVIAQFFGATFGVDAFIVANKIPNFMRRLFAEGAFCQAFVPVLSEYKVREEGGAHGAPTAEGRLDDIKVEDLYDVKAFVDTMAGVLGSVLLLITLIGIIAAPIVIIIFAPGFHLHSQRFDLSTEMLRYTFPYLLFISLTAFAGAILNTYHRFAIPAFTPVLLNISLIVAAVFLSPYFQTPVVALAVGVLIAGIVQLLFQIPFLWQLKLVPRPKLNFSHPGVNKVCKLMIPALFGVSVSQINLMIDQWFASFLKVGSISWLYYSDRITSLPLGVFAVAIATVILPTLSRQHAGKSTEAFSKTLDWGIRLILLLGVPCMVGLLLLSGPILSTLFQYGAFGVHDVEMARLSMMAFSLGIVAVMLVKVLASGFYAKQNIKLPVKIAVVAMVSNTLISLCLIWFLYHVGLALATSISGILNAGLLLYFLHKHGLYHAQPGWLKYGGQLFVATLLMAVFILWASGHLSTWLAADWHWKAGHLAMILLGAVVVYFAALILTGWRLQ